MFSPTSHFNFVITVVFKSIFILMFTVLNIGSLHGQVKYLKYPIYIDVSKGYLLYSLNRADSSTITWFSLGESNKLKIFDNNDNGTLTFILSDTFTGKFIKGKYAAGQLIKTDPSKIKRDRYRITVGAKNPTLSKYYYRPLRSGTWCYYDSTGHCVKTEEYEKGKLIVAQ